MPRYLFTSDQRISVLPDRIKWVANFIISGHSISEILDKSDNNNATTLKFYYNLHCGTETCEKAATDPLFTIRNFVLKFQFPNTRTHESLKNSIADNLLLAPFRSIVSLLYALKNENYSSDSYMTMSEILYFVFCNPLVYSNPSVNYTNIAKDIEYTRKQHTDLDNKVSALLDWNQYGRQARELINVLTYASECFKFTKGNLYFSTTHPKFETDKDFINSLILYNKFWYPTNYNNFQLSTSEYISYMNTTDTPYSVIEFKPNIVQIKNELEVKSLQIIYYGAPGTGKSNKIEECTNDSNRIRTTFHPDSDYSTFVGAYKPTMEETGVTVAGKKETRIAYKYVPQAFLKAYVNAWKRIDNGDNSPYYLVIEEINRGNCAQIFGDLFQLLDRGDNGESKYAICPDDDIRRYLAEQFSSTTIIPENIKNGKEMRLPSNLYIWATMNTSDQSLFPIDSAFKRRWDWEYMPIEKGDKAFIIEIGNKKYDWWNFISIINDKIDEITGSEDKKLGYWFAKPAGNSTIISCDQFVSKVLFYLWNDVYKDYTDDNRSIFRITDDSSSKKVVFSEFFGIGRELKLQAFMKYNGIAEIPLEGNE